MRSALKPGLLFLLAPLLVCGLAQAQAVRVGKPLAQASGATPQTAVSSLSLTASPASVSFQLAAGKVAAGSTAVNITTTWGGTFCLLTCTINVYGYFASSTAALTSASADIPTSEILGEVPTGIPTTYTAFTQTNPFGGGGASLQLVQQSFFLLTGGGSRTDALSLEINLANQPQLPAGNYTGTLYIQAQAL